MASSCSTPRGLLLPHSTASRLPSSRSAYIPSSIRAPQLFNLIQSSPLLENLNQTGNGEPFGDDDNPCDVQTVVPSTSPPLTGSLTLSILEGMGDTVRPLLDLPNGLHFRRLTLSSHRGDSLQRITALVEVRSDTLEFLYVAYTPGGTFVSHLHLHLQLTPVISWVGLGFDRSLGGDKTQRRSFSVRIA